MTEAADKKDGRLSWLERRLQATFSHVKADKFAKGFYTEENNAVVEDFFNNADSRIAIISQDTIIVTNKFPKKLNKAQKCAAIIKLKSGAVTDKEIQSQLLYSECLSDSLPHLEVLLQEVYLPLLSNPRNQKGWGEVSVKEIIDMLHAFLSEVTITCGQLKGETCLPLPPSFDGASATNNKERIHLLETAVITWTKQIRSVLNLDPESVMKKGQNPTPDAEIEFWIAKAANLNSIYSQLQGERIRKVLKFLESSKSTYCTAFAKICKEVILAREEANDNVKYLNTLKVWFERLNTVLKFEMLVDFFKPIMHIILLVWKNSQHYNTAARLVVLIREICNALINQACKYVSGEEIFRLIEADEAKRAVEMLKTTLRVCGSFRSTYFDYKTTANSECPTNQWKLQNNALFMRLDSFLERCHDILDLTETILQFSKLAKIEVGGTKGKALSEIVKQIHEDFEHAVQAFKNVSYDIMDVGAKQFDDDFYNFRCRIKELERRLGNVITTSFDDCNTIYACFKLLDSFDGLLERPIILDELEKKHVSLVQHYGRDLKIVQEFFLKDKDEPPIGSNLPPIAGALMWCRGLIERISEPMEKLRLLNKSIMEREEAKEVIKMYDMLTTTLQDYKTEKISEWVLGVESTSQIKLKLPLLARDEFTRKLAVNFDPALVKLLREVKYFLLHGLEIPETAVAIYKKNEQYRQYTGNLDLIVNMYNNIIETLLPVEAPLVKQYIDRVDSTVQQGINSMSWKSPSIDKFIVSCRQNVTEANKILASLKENLGEVEKVLKSWNSGTLMTRATKPITPAEFKTKHQAELQAQYKNIKESGAKIHTYLAESNKTLKVGAGMPDWRAYVDFANNVVVQGLSNTILKSLQYVVDQIDPANIEKLGLTPMLQIELNLVGIEVMFVPSVKESSDGRGVRDLVSGWIDSFMVISTLFKRLDNGNGKYLKEMQENMELQMMVATINELFEATELECDKFRQKFVDYAFLWKSDLNTEFDRFVEDATLVSESGSKRPDLDKFRVAIEKYKKVETDVENLSSAQDIHWIRVNSHPIKQALLSWVKKWVYRFTSYLVNHVETKLVNIHDFIGTAMTGLEEDVVEGDNPALIRVMGHIRDVRNKADDTKGMFGPLKDQIALLKLHSISMEGRKIGTFEALDFLEQAPQKWERVSNMAYNKKEVIVPLQNKEAENVKATVEAFFQEMRNFRGDFRANAPFSHDGPAEEAYNKMQGYFNQLGGLNDKKSAVNSLEDLFALPVSKYTETAETLKELKLLKQLWDFKCLVLSTYESWEKILWSDIDTDDLADQNKKLLRYVRAMGTSNQIIKGWQVFKDTEAMLKNMDINLPLVNSLHSPSMQERHWKNLARVCNVKQLKNKDPKFCLKDLLDLNLFEHELDINEIVDVAGKELKVEKKLKAIEEVWTSLQFKFYNHRTGDVKLLKVPDEVVESLEQHQQELQSMIAMGKAVEHFKDTVLSWQQKLGTVESVQKNWVNITKQWESLESIFLASADIRAQLPEDTKRFEGLDVEFKELMRSSSETPNVIEACTAEGREELMVKNLIPSLELCQKSLTKYLDEKKKKFPRFYFVSNVALLDILSNGNEPPRIMHYIGDCYDSLDKVLLVDGFINRGHSMIAKDREIVKFHETFVMEGGVEYWLNDLTDMMMQTLKNILNDSIQAAVGWDNELPRHKWLFDYCAQVVLTACAVEWTEETQAALEEYENGAEEAVMTYVGVCNVRLNELIKLVQGDLKKFDRTKIIALITMDVHSRDVVQKLVDSKATGPGSFQWQQQLRNYYKPETKDVEIRITDYKTLYFYEYVGNTGRLVITPLTDRCYITLTMAMRLMLGGAPAGPAGTGKTETTKDLGRALALPVYVFNCSDQMNFQTLGDIFKGLAQSGAWGCFDEFNRIPIEVLSVVATQVKTILDAIVQFCKPANREEKYQKLPAGQPPVVVGYFEFMKDVIQLIPTCGFFITMNPGYAGRTELPENVKALFRSCAMIRPDLEPICENMLMAEGFLYARPLAVKFVRLYSLSSELLSPQVHYDWGLRSVKSVLRVAGSLKRAERDVTEEGILMRALRDFNTPKMPLADLPIYLRLIQDLFPASAGLAVKLDPSLKEKAIQVCKKTNLQPDDGFVAKVVNFQELLDVRHSVMLMGPAGCAKSRIWKTLQGCHNMDKPKPICVAKVVNPKAVTTDELYGCMTLAKEWKDGVLSIIMRGMSKNTKELMYSETQTMKWSVLDDDIDAVWIESMNTVMDDNKVLTLVSNERVPLSDAMRMVFEIDSLKNATPATVSRAGILFINETDIGWRPFVESWISTFKEDARMQATLPGLFDGYVDTLLDSMKKQYKSVVPLYTMNKIQTMCYLIEGLAKTVKGDKTPEMIEKIFVFSCVWAFGGPLVSDKLLDHRKGFNDLWGATFAAKANSKFPTDPKDATCFDFFYDPATNEWVHWRNKIQEYTPLPIGSDANQKPFKDIFVHTVDTTRLIFISDVLVKMGRPVMMVGTAGTGKTVICREYLSNMSEEWLASNINMSFFTTSASLQKRIEGTVSRRSGTTYGPPSGKKLVFFLDDMNLPQVETYGTQNSLSLLRQIIDYKFFYDRTDLGIVSTLVDVQFMAAMNPTSGSFTVSDRVQIHFSTFCCSMPDSSDVKRIYQNIVEGQFKNSGFDPKIAEMSDKLVSATIALHNLVSTRFLPSAVRFTYNWNMRELANIFQGVCEANASYYKKPEILARLWLHECYRVFQDRMVDDEDMETLNEFVLATSKTHFADDFGTQEVLHAKPLVYTHFHTPQLSYLPVAAGEEGDAKLKQVVDSKLQEYNEAFSIMELVLFQQAIYHVTRITRIISNPSGNAMLVGVGGSGKQSLSRLAAFICGCEVKQLSVTSNFKVDDLKENLRQYYILAAVKNTPIVWLFTDSQIVQEKFLVYINDLLCSGWIADLFEKADLEAAIGGVRNDAKAAGISESPEALLEFFIARIKKNLHVILCFSPVGEKFRVRARRFPGLINATAINFFHPWPRDALISVAHRFLGDVELGTDTMKENIAHHMSQVHLSVTEISREYITRNRRYNYVTPKSFLELINFYKALLASKRIEVSKLVDRLDVGLSTLRKTAADVAELQIDLSHTMEDVEKEKTKTNKLLDEMGIEREKAEVQQAKATIEKEKADDAAAKAAVIEASASTELAMAQPAMDAAADAIKCLDKSSLSVLKTLGTPPDGVTLVTDCCLMMLRNDMKPKNDWGKAKKMLADPGKFLAEVQKYRGEDMTESLIMGMQPYIDNKDMTPENIMGKSSAAGNLCKWVQNIFIYNRIYVKVKPLMDSLNAARASKKEALDSLATSEAIVAAVQLKLQGLKDTLVAATEAKAKIEAEAQKCLDKLGLAKRLVNGLSSENERWGREIETLRERESKLVGDVLLSAAFTSYVGGFDAEFRMKLWKETWLPDLVSREIPLSDGTDPLVLLATDKEMAQMLSEGLPADRISMENGAVVCGCKRWPLMIDPQLQGIKWLRKRCGEEAVYIQLTQSDWLRKIGDAVSLGKTVVIENLGEEIDPTLDPVLGRAITKKGRAYFVRLGGEEMEYDLKFKLFLQTKLTNPHYKPEVQAQCTLINFIATERGLEDQLLAKVVQVEKPEMERQKQELQDKFNVYKIQLLDLENALLERLANAPEDILSDIPLIESLEATKATATEINAAVTLGKETEKEINKAREIFRSVASEGAMLYFMLVGLYQIDHMYQYSLDAFTIFFYKALERAVAADEQGERVKNLRSSLRFTIYRWVARGLFVDHKLILLSQLTFNLMRRNIINEDGLNMEYFNYLLRGPRKEGTDNPLDWLPDTAWKSVQALKDFDEFTKLPDNMQEASPRFKEWFNHVTPESERLPLEWAKLEKFPLQKMLVLRALRPDRMMTALSNFVRQTLPDGDAYVDCDGTLNSVQILQEAINDSSTTTPLYFILSPGADVVGDLDKIADKMGMVKGASYHNVSMGQGQDVIAEACLSIAHKQGHWCIFNNVHLMPTWLEKLEKILDVYAIEKSHPKFRLFLTSDPSNSIPLGILNRSIKLTNEPPAGLKANLKRAFCSFPKEKHEEFESKVKSIVFGLCHFHSLMLERKKFGAKGYNMMYPFSLGDLRDSTECLKNYMENAGSFVPWQDLKYIFGEIMYGGHIVNDFDRLMCMTYLDHIMKDELLDESELIPFGTEDKISFKTIPPSPFEKYLEHMDTAMPADTPIAFGLHPNAEIDFRTTQSNNMFLKLMELQPRDAAAAGGVTPQHVVALVLNDIMEKFGEVTFDLDEISALIEVKGPFQNVFLQECLQMNVLLDEIRRSLKELFLGLNGELTMSDPMEALADALFLGRTPLTWKKLSWPSLRPLNSWLIDMAERIKQLNGWKGTPLDIPIVTWISGLFNPQSFLTAIMQQTAQTQRLELDKLVVQTEITKRTVEDCSMASREGNFIHGLSLDGARWDMTAAIVDKARPREMFCPMPVIVCKAVPADKNETSGIFLCPVYKTPFRGPTYVFSAQLKTKSPPARWIMAGVALIMDTTS